MTPPLAPLLQKARNWKELQGRLAALDRKAQGDLFETLCRQFLRWHPAYSQLFAEVWLEADIPLSVRKHCQLPKGDKGLDGLALTRDGRYFGIQCKYLSDTKGSLSRQAFATATDQAFTQSRHIDGLVLMTTRERVTSEAARYRYDFIQITLGDWEELSGESWTQFRAFVTGESRKALPKPYKPRLHQRRALQNARRHFLDEGNTRGKLIHPCGSGKSLTGFWLAEALGARKIVVAVPSLTLVRQTYRTWLREFRARGEEVDWLAVCSDKSVGRLSRLEEDEVVGSLQELGVDAHTDPAFIAAWLSRETPRRQVVFTTYQSGEALSEGVRRADYRFDTGIFDEAHKTVGQSTKLFSHLLHDEHIPVARRIYMTATERVFRGAGDEILSMDDPAVYGETFDFFSFKQAIESDPPVLTDYKVLVLAVTQAEIQRYIENNVLIRTKGLRWDDDVEASMLASLIALNKAHQQYSIRHTVSFHGSIARAVAFRENQERINALGLFTPMDTFHVTGKTSTSERNREIEAFASSDNGLITNARCLTEGVDVPNIDCVLFADPRRSRVDIVQAVGRALRLAEGKTNGHILLPIILNENESTQNQSSKAYKDIISVLQSLATQDQRIIEEIKQNQLRERDLSSHLVEFIFKDVKEITIGPVLDAIEVKIWSSLKKLQWPAFHEAREIARNLNLKGESDWRKLFKEGNNPKELPYHPDRVYKELGWIDWGDWLGTGNIASQKIEFKNYEDAKQYAIALNLSNSNAWRNHCKNGKLPTDIPANPNHVYSGKGWKSWADWLGTSFVATNKREYLPFEEARTFVQKLNLRTGTEWYAYVKRGIKPDNIPATPREVYENEGWVGMGDWLGTNRIASQHKKYLSFNEARNFAHGLGLQSQKQWFDYCKTAELPENIPAGCYNAYRDKGWISWADWLGTNNEAPKDKVYKPFSEARAFVHTLNLKSSSEWRKYSSSGDKPDDIPSNPNTCYKSKGWVDISDWLGIPNKKKLRTSWLPFKEARQYIHALGLRNTEEWIQYSKSSHFPNHLIPSNPRGVYRDSGWISMGDWLGTQIVANKKKPFLDFLTAREYVRALNLKSVSEFQKWYKNFRPELIPSSPIVAYRDRGWVSWQDWLGYEKPFRPVTNWRPFVEARAYVHSLNLPSRRAWRNFTKSGKLPVDIPSNPERVYRPTGWKNMGDWLGSGTIRSMDKKFMNFSQARAFVRNLSLKSMEEWKLYCKSGKKPENIPYSPNRTYKNVGWVNYGDWLGTGKLASKDIAFLSYNEAQQLVSKLHLQTAKEWREYAKSGKRPANIPAAPERSYKDKGWTNWEHWLGKSK